MLSDTISKVFFIFTGVTSVYIILFRYLIFQNLSIFGLGAFVKPLTSLKNKLGISIKAADDKQYITTRGGKCFIPDATATQSVAFSIFSFLVSCRQYIPVKFSWTFKNVTKFYKIILEDVSRGIEFSNANKN